MSRVGRALATLTAAAVVVVLAGCTSPAQPVPVGSHTAAASTTPSSPSSPSTPAVKALAGGDCTQLLASSSLVTALGLSAEVQVATGDPVLAVVGGIGCDWSFGKPDKSYRNQVQLAVAPGTIADSSEVAASLTSPPCSTHGHYRDCTATISVAGWWYNLDVSLYNPKSKTAVRTSFGVITTDLEAALKAASAPAAELVHPFDCAAASTKSVPLVSSRSLQSDYGEISAAYQEIFAAAFLLAGPTTCAATATSGWSVTVYPGSTSAYYECAHSLNGAGESVTIPGFGTAFALDQDSADAPLICATDGKSTITAADSFHQSGDPWNTNDSEALALLLVRAFASAKSAVAPWRAALVAPSAPVTVQPPAAGKCTTLLDTKVAVVAVHATKVSTVQIGDPLLATVGGLDCDYLLRAHGGGYNEIRLVVAPSAIADPAELHASLASPACGADPTGDDVTACTATVAVDGWWYSAYVDGLDSDAGPAASKATFAAITANFEHALASGPAPGRIAAKKPFDCQSANPEGLPVASMRASFFPLRPSAPEIRAAAFLLAGPEACEFTEPDGQSWSLTVYPGSASAYYSCTKLEAGAGQANEPLSVPGVKTALALSPDGSGSEVCATDGKSTVFAIWERPDAPPWNAAARKTLGSLLVPVFAAIK